MRSLPELLTLTIEFMEGKLPTKPLLKNGICHAIWTMEGMGLVTQAEQNWVIDFLHENKPNYWRQNPNSDSIDQIFGFFFPCMERGEEFINLRIDYLKTLLEKSQNG